MSRPIPFGRPLLSAAEKKAVAQVLEGDILVHGPLAKEFESAFAAFTKAPYAVSVSSCTAGLHLCYFRFRIGIGDEVIVPAQTHVATAHAVELVGAKPVFVDCERRTGNIDIDAIEAAITPRTKAISVVHYLGLPVDMRRVMAIAEKHNLLVVEDCALALGSTLDGKHMGIWGDAGCFSFYPVKHITTAEGGMIITRHEDHAFHFGREKAFGVDRTASERTVPGVYDVTMLGFNYRMNEIAAAMGIEQVKRAQGFLDQRRKNYEVLQQELEDLSECSFLESTRDEFQSSYYCFSMILSEKLAPKRFEIVSELKKREIGTSVYYPRAVPHFTYYREKYGYLDTSFPNAAWISNNSIALSVGPHLNEDDMRYQAGVVKEVLAGFVR